MSTQNPIVSIDNGYGNGYILVIRANTAKVHNKPTTTSLGRLTRTLNRQPSGLRLDYCGVGWEWRQAHVKS